MYSMGKGFHPANFVFDASVKARSVRVGGARCTLRAVGTAGDVYHVRLENKALWPKDYSRSALTPLRGATADCVGEHSRLQVNAKFELTLRDRAGEVLLRSLPGQGFGLSASSWMFRFVQDPQAQFYGLGEKSNPYEKSGRAHKFWNTDAYGDFPGDQIANADYDPDYISIPWLIIKRGNQFTGILMDTPWPSIVSVGRRGEANSDFWLGAENGAPSLYIIHGPSLAELVRKFQRLSGMAPLPPLWAFGYHQSRWGYQSPKDLHWLADNLEKHKFPADGLWLDIEYMLGYRVFTFNPDNFPNHRADLAKISKRGYRVVPIVDPGVKQERGYPVYDSGRKAGVFCCNQMGREFVGQVWPGLTVFPDFSLARTQAWWAGYMKQFALDGVGGAWLDMNDPSTGWTECVGMLFENGKVTHDAFHNQYATLMAKASREGFLAARPNERPFLISRSGHTGSQKWCGHWTGDNASNYRHLQRSISRTLNLAMSGVAFNAPDIGGFMGDTTPQLLVDWMKTCFLFPFTRNHTCAGTRRQEPWEFGPKVLNTLRHYARMRYKLIPYIYNLFAEHELSGEAVLRPLNYDFDDSKSLSLGPVDDQFLVGPYLMQAPLVVENATSRNVALPDGRWFSLHRGAWVAGGRSVKEKKEVESTPMYVRDGALIPMQKGTPVDSRKNLSEIELLVGLSSTFSGTAATKYVFDDGLSFDYRTGKRSVYQIRATRSGAAVRIDIKATRTGYGTLALTPVMLDACRSVTVVENGRERALKPSLGSLALAGKPVKVWHWK